MAYKIAFYLISLCWIAECIQSHNKDLKYNKRLSECDSVNHLNIVKLDSLINSYEPAYSIINKRLKDGTTRN